MPLHAEYKDNIKSKIADIKNIGDGKAGSITAALFLQEFVAEGREWAHIDMAGPVWDNATHKPTGYGVKLLLTYILDQAAAVARRE
jgi:leucyl aminopeptidase